MVWVGGGRDGRTWLRVVGEVEGFYFYCLEGIVANDRYLRNCTCVRL